MRFQGFLHEVRVAEVQAEGLVDEGQSRRLSVDLFADEEEVREGRGAPEVDAQVAGRRAEDRGVRIVVMRGREEVLVDWGADFEG